MQRPATMEEFKAEMRATAAEATREVIEDKGHDVCECVGCKCRRKLEAGLDLEPQEWDSIYGDYLEFFKKEEAKSDLLMGLLKQALIPETNRIEKVAAELIESLKQDRPADGTTFTFGEAGKRMILMDDTQKFVLYEAFAKGQRVQYKGGSDFAMFLDVPKAGFEWIADYWYRIVE